MALVNDPKSSWQVLYRAALNETDKKKLTDLILAAEEAIFLRAQELTSAVADNEERTTMAEAARNLLTIKSEKLGWPGFK